MAAVAEQPALPAQDVADLLALLSLPTFAKASLLGGGASLLVQTSQKSADDNRSRTSLAVARLDVSAPELLSFGTELKGASLALPSPSGAFLLVVRNGDGAPAPSGAAPAPVMLEVWGGGRLLREVEVPSATHGAVVTDGQLESPAGWSPDEARVVYTAEAPPAARTPLWGGRAPAGSAGALAGGAGPDAAASAASTGWRGVGPFEPDWGEQMSGRRRSCLFVLGVADGSLMPVTTAGVPESASCGAAVWAPGGDELVFVAFPPDGGPFPTPNRLGLVYCQNRACGLWRAPAPHAAAAAAAAATAAAAEPHPSPAAPAAPPARCSALTPRLASAFSPRFHPSGRFVACLSAGAACASGAHAATLSLHAVRWEPQPQQPAAAPAVVCLLPVPPAVSEDRSPDGTGAPPPAAFPSSFPGLYLAAQLPRAPFAEPGGAALLVASAWGAGDAVLRLRLPADPFAPASSRPGAQPTVATVERLTPPGSGHWALLDVAPRAAVAALSTPCDPHGLRVARWAEEQAGAAAGGGGGGWSVWAELPQAHAPAPPPALAPPRTLAWSLLPVPRPAGGPAAGLAEAIVLRPAAAAPRAPAAAGAGAPTPPPPPPPRCVLVPHGGPHSACAAAFVPALAWLASRGYCVLQVNYCGSTGYGEPSLAALAGRTGDSDVGDCLAALGAAAAAGLCAPEGAFALGGSHGGFIGAHLIARAPGTFAAAALRNPVTDIAAMAGSTDIPDWCFVETPALGKAAFSEPPTGAQLAAMHAASPVAGLAAVRAPVLLLLGGRDRRVPPATGLAYARALRARGVPVRTLLFPDDEHPLSRPRTEVESFIEILAWFRAHAGGGQASG